MFSSSPYVSSTYYLRYIPNPELGASFYSTPHLRRVVISSQSASTLFPYASSSRTTIHRLFVSMIYQYPSMISHRLQTISKPQSPAASYLRLSQMIYLQPLLSKSYQPHSHLFKPRQTFPRFQVPHDSSRFLTIPQDPSRIPHDSSRIPGSPRSPDHCHKVQYM
jgi:hypothetical protein